MINLDSLHTFLKSGKSYSEAAVKFGVTRSTISGQASRHFGGHPNPIARGTPLHVTAGYRNGDGQTNGATPKGRKRKANTVAERALVKKVLPDRSGWKDETGHTGPVTFDDLEAHHCRWPVDGGYCGQHRNGRSSYCDFHHSKSVRWEKAE